MMQSTADNPTNSAARSRNRRRAVLLGAGIGGLLVVGYLGYRIYDAAATPPTPRMDSADVGEIIQFIINDRGLLRLPRIEQERFLAAWRKQYGVEANQRKLKKHLDGMSDESRQALREILFLVSKREFLADAEQYLRLRGDPTKAYRFVHDRIDAFTAQVTWLKGGGDPSRDLSEVMGSGLPRNPEDWTRFLVARTTPEERVLGEQYLDAIKNVREQERKMRRGSAASQQASGDHEKRPSPHGGK